MDADATRRRILIAGSSRGIGRGIALKLAKKGSRIAIHYFRNEESAKQTLADARSRGADGFLIQADVSDPEQISRMMRQVDEQFGGLDVFSNARRPWNPSFSISR